MSTTDTDIASGRAAEGSHRPVDPAQGGQAARPGPGRLLRRRAPARNGLRPLRPLAVRAREDRLDRRDAPRSRSTASTGRSPATRSRSTPIRSSRCRSRPATRSRTTRSRSARRGSWASRSRRSARARASWRATPPSSSRSSTSRSTCSSTRARRSRTRRSCTRTPARTSSGAASSTGATGRRRSPRPTTSSRSSGSTSTASARRRSSAAGALVEYERGTGQWTLYCNHQMPGVGAIWMAPALRCGIDKLRFVTQDIGGAFGNKICLHPYFVALCLLARKLNRPVQWTEWRTDQHTANAHGNERTFLDVEVAVKADGTMLGFKVKAIDDCGAFPRYEPLGCIIWAQVTPGCYGWRNIRVDFTQVCTNKSPVSPNRGYSRMQHLWLTERIVDIVGAELGARSGRGAQAQLRQGRADAVRDAERLRLRLRRLRALPRHRARADRLRLARGAARGRGGARQAARLRDRLDARLRHEQLRPVAAPQPRAPVLGQQRGGDGQARHLRRGRRHARHRPAGTGPRDDRLAGRRRHPRLLARPGARAAGPRLVLQLARRLLRHVREPVRGHRPRRGEGRRRAPARRDDQARGGRAAGAGGRRSSSRTASRGSRTARRRRRCRSWRSARS